ncbi:MAG: DUF58 domain-containing protein [Acidimicrobiia bacterium]|nr:DUF58 domain-containing protein [Acidimicrobiia bacterium]
MMLTDRGWAALGASLALIVLWVALGEDELLAAAVMLVLGTVIASVYVRLARPMIEVTRQLNPGLVHEGDQAIVEATLVHNGRFPLVNPTFEDEVEGLGSARFFTDTLRRGERVSAVYQILCRPRGVYRVGPARIMIRDPLRLARNGGLTGESDKLIVYPEVEDLEGFPVVRGRDPSVHASRPEFSHRGGEDFFTIREYQTGDDLRRVHWPTSAKRDQLMIKQLETPWQSRALVLFDIRTSVYPSPTAFEKAVRGAASIIRHLYRSGFEAEMWAGGRVLSSKDPAAYSSVMETLAMVRPDHDVDIRAVAARLQRSGRGGALLLVTGRPDHDLFAAQQLLSNEYRSTVLLAVTSAPTPDTLLFQKTGAATVIVPQDGSWAEAWLSATTRSWTTVSAV